LHISNTMKSQKLRDLNANFFFKKKLCKRVELNKTFAAGSPIVTITVRFEQLIKIEKTTYERPMVVEDKVTNKKHTKNNTDV
jgi:hypothetical protein